VPENLKKKDDDLGEEADKQFLLADIATLTKVEFDNRLDQDVDFRKGVFDAATNFTTNESMQQLDVASIDEIISGSTKGVVNIGGEPFKIKKTFKVDPQRTNNELGQVLGGTDWVHLAVISKLNQEAGEESPHFIILNGQNKGKIISRKEGGLLHTSPVENFLDLLPTFLEGDELEAFDKKFREDSARIENN